MSILERLKQDRVVSVKLKDGKFRVREECDRYFEVNLEPVELVELGQELIKMAVAASMVLPTEPAIDQAAAAERERCARIAEFDPNTCGYCNPGGKIPDFRGECIAEKIRSK